MKRNYLTPSVRICIREQADVLTASFTSATFDSGDHLVNWNGTGFDSQGGN